MRNSSIFIFNFEHVSYFFLVFLLLTLNRWMFAEQVNVCKPKLFDKAELINENQNILLRSA